MDIDSIIKGSVPTVKLQAYRNVTAVDAPDPLTVVIHLKQPDPGLLPNLSDGAIGIIPAGSGRDFGRHLIGSGPFRFVSQEQDKEVVIERNPSLLVATAKSRARPLRSGSRLHHASPGTAKRLRRRRGKCLERRPGLRPSKQLPARRLDRPRNSPQLHLVQHPRPDPQGRPRSPGNRGRHQSPLDHSDTLERSSTARGEPPADQPLGVDGRGRGDMTFDPASANSILDRAG